MKAQIRQGVFETNSSSVHSITICSKTDYDKWIKGEILLNEEKQFISREEAIEELKKLKEEYDGSLNINYDNKAEVDEYLFKWLDIWNYEYYCDYVLKYYEGFSEEYTTENGDMVVAFGYFG